MKTNVVRNLAAVVLVAIIFLSLYLINTKMNLPLVHIITVMEIFIGVIGILITVGEKAQAKPFLRHTGMIIALVAFIAVFLTGVLINPAP
jgi:hypothetical protein